MALLRNPRQFGQLEKIIRGFSNHRRIQFLYLLARRPNQDLKSIARACGVKFQTASEHLRRLSAAGLVSKRKRARQVLHACTPLGRRVLSFLDEVG